jgi:hypothetical protein
MLALLPSVKPIQYCFQLDADAASDGAVASAGALTTCQHEAAHALLHISTIAHQCL